MRARPRRAENRVAEELSKWFISHGFSPIERKPIIGRTGPDFTFNELKLVIDAKSRIQVPTSYIGIPTSEMICYFGEADNLLGVSLQSLDLILTDQEPETNWFDSKIVFRWYYHMKEWQINNMPDGITALVLHRPGMHFDKASFIISEEDRKVLYDRISNR